ncbi:MAG: N-formylglutamate amidohydrolase [Geminicoccaceae bacterium]|nr:N-formylglutamate amidohydrolase [Geminicoccaceae bacterium]
MTGEPYTLVRPDRAGDALPILYDSPHSGREYPDDFGSALDLSLLRRAEDAHVDELLLEAPAQGVSLLHAHFPRAYVDANRARDDVDPRILDRAPSMALHPGEKSSMRIGLIREIVTPGLNIYDRKLSWSEVERRIERCWLPYRNALTSVLGELRQRHGRVLHVQWHSMKSVGNAATPDGPGRRRPDMVVGDRFGTSCTARTRDLLLELLREGGYAVSLNDPYAGGAILSEIADPGNGIESLQVEINRGLYLDEAKVEKTLGFERLKSNISALTEQLARRWQP